MSLRCAAALVATVLTSLPALSSAKASLQARLSLSAGWTDNILSQTDAAQSDFFGDVRPSLILSSAAPRAVQQIGYEFDGLLYFTRPEANSYTHTLRWNCFFYTSPSTTLLLGAALTEGRLNSIGSQVSAQTPVAVTQPGGTTFLSGAVTEQLTWDITRSWRLTHTLALTGYLPIDPANSPTTVDLDQRLAIEHAFRIDVLGAEYHSGYSSFSAVRGPVPSGDGVDPDGVVRPEQDVLINGLRVKWRHDLGRYFSSELDLGFVEASCLKCPPPNPGAGPAQIQPAGLAALHFIHDYGAADLTYQHNIQPNAILATTFVVDSAELRINLPLGRLSGVRLSAAGAYQFARQLDFGNGNTLSNTHVVLADATLSYNPPRRREIGIFARYSYFNQLVNPDDLTPQPSFTRNTVVIGVSGVYPLQPAAVVPTRESVRADRSDDPRISEPHSDPTKPKS